MSLQHVPPVSRHSRGFRGNRLAQPARNRESLKRPQPDTSNYVEMPDGERLCPAVFHHLRSNSHQVMNGDLAGCAKRLLEFSTPYQRAKLESWLQTHRGKRAHVDTANDNLMAVLLDYTGAKMRNKLNAFSMYVLVMETESMHAVVPLD